jgi:3-oxoacyl-[acyl-carrier-protein] synthase II
MRLSELEGQSFPFPFGAYVRDFTEDMDEFPASSPALARQIRKGLKLMCREIQFGLAAAQGALMDSAVRQGEYDPVRFGVSFGSDHIVAAPDEFHEAYRSCLRNGHPFSIKEWGRRGMHQITPLWLLKFLPNMPASHIAIYNDLRGPNNSLTHREASGGLAIAEAAAVIRRGSADRMLVGATGSSLGCLRAIQSSFLGEVVLAGDDPAEACRPFDLRRRGMVPGEGSAAIVLEDAGSARRRQAKVYGEILGAASSCVRSRAGSPDIQLAVRNAIGIALSRAELQSDEIGHINAHGLGSRWGDHQEARAIQEVLAESAGRTPVVAHKASLGNLGAAGGLVELIISLMAMRQGRLLPQRNLTHPDPECPVHVPLDGGTPSGRICMKINYTPSGQACALLVRGLDASELSRNGE